MSEFIIGSDQLAKLSGTNIGDIERADTLFGNRLERIIRCRDCDFGKDYGADLSFRDCSMMRHKIVPEDNFCGLAKPKGFCAMMIEPKEEA